MAQTDLGLPPEVAAGQPIRAPWWNQLIRAVRTLANLEATPPLVVTKTGGGLTIGLAETFEVAFWSRVTAVTPSAPGPASAVRVSGFALREGPAGSRSFTSAPLLDTAARADEVDVWPPEVGDAVLALWLPQDGRKAFDVFVWAPRLVVAFGPCEPAQAAQTATKAEVDALEARLRQLEGRLLGAATAGGSPLGRA